MIEVTFWKVFGTVVGFLIINAIALYFGIFKRQNKQGTKLEILQTNINNLIDTTNVNRGNLNDRIDALDRTLNQRIVDVVQQDINEIQKKYRKIKFLLDEIDNQSNNLEQARQLLEIVKENSKNINIINELGNFKRQLSKIENTQKSQGIIKIGKCGSDKISNKKFPELVDSSEHKIREARIDIDFGDTFSSLSDEANIGVFVALAKVDAGYGYKNAIRVHVFAQSISKKGFTLVARTWENSTLFYGDVVWIAVGK